jgi:uncharacterized protein (DUF2147 family)
MNRFASPFLAVFCLSVVFACAAPLPCAGEDLSGDAILGTWVVAEKDAHIEIYRQDNRYYGRICWLRGGDPKPGEPPDPNMYETPRVGLVIVRGFSFDGKKWRWGTLYNPTDGRSYRGIINLDDKGRLHVRGFLGISLLGRTTIWQRVQ